jgi:nucleotidyltransferase/DNA polymerase involved in DNA repair
VSEGKCALVAGAVFVPNYVALSCRIKKGMFLGRAKQPCPSRIVLPYDFEGYDDVSEQVAAILQRYASQYDGEVEQVACD